MISHPQLVLKILNMEESDQSGGPMLLRMVIAYSGLVEGFARWMAELKPPIQNIASISFVFQN